MESQYSQIPFKKKGRPNLLNDNFLKKVNDVVVGTRAVGAVISSCLVIAIGNGVVKSNNPTMLMENGSPLELTEDRTRGVLKSLKWTKRKQTTGKMEPSKQLHEEENLKFSCRTQCFRGTYHKLRSDTVVFRHLW